MEARKQENLEKVAMGLSFTAWQQVYTAVNEYQVNENRGKDTSISPSSSLLSVNFKNSYFVIERVAGKGMIIVNHDAVAF